MFWAAEVRTRGWDACTCDLAPSRTRQALAARAEPRCPDDGHGDPRADTSSNGGFAIVVAG
eukprot:13722240-Alexandrium_andersonii.AAC.1